MDIACERGFVYTKPLLASFFLLSWRGLIFASGAESVPVPCCFGFMPPWALLCALWRLFVAALILLRVRSRQAAAGALWLSEVEQPDSTDTACAMVAAVRAGAGESVPNRDTFAGSGAAAHGLRAS